MLSGAGWRSLVKNISKSLIDKMIFEFGSNHEDIIVYIGPHIQKCHFEIKEDIAAEFEKKFIIKDGGLIKADMLSLIKSRLLECGIRSDNINFSNECT